MNADFNFNFFSPSISKTTDSVDDSLGIEKQNLHVFKRSLEQILKPIQDHLFVNNF